MFSKRCSATITEADISALAPLSRAFEPRGARKSSRWTARLVREIVNRCRLVLFSPTFGKYLEIQSKWKDQQQQRMAEEYAKGYLDGWHECYAACLDAVEHPVGEDAEIWTVADLFTQPGHSAKAN
jgi:hypothetical protein